MIGVKEKKEYWGQEIRQKMKNFLSNFVIWRQFLTGGVSYIIRGLKKMLETALINYNILVGLDADVYFIRICFI